MKKIISLLPLFLLLIITCLSLSNKLPFERSTFLSSELTAVKTDDGNTVRTDYFDAEGQLTCAANLQYATVIKTKNDQEKVVREEYLDEEGNPAIRKAGHSGLARFYDEHGKNTRLIYLDAEGRPIMTVMGYAEVRREFNKAGKVEREFYYDTEGKPVQSSLGVYGAHKEYNAEGKNSRTTYLGPDGLPMKTSRGYVSVEYIYDKEGKLLQKHFFDAEGKPTTSGRRQYGIEYLDGKSVYLDENGNPMQRLDNMLNNAPFAVAVAGVLLLLLAVFSRGRLRMVLLIFYLWFIGLMTIWYREFDSAGIKLELFWSYRQFLTNPSIRKDILNNIWLFVPLGALLYKPGSRRWLIPGLISIVIEVIQYLTGLGLCEFDDVISNSLGGWIGYLAAAGLTEVNRGDLYHGKA